MAWHSMDVISNESPPALHNALIPRHRTLYMLPRQAVTGSETGGGERKLVSRQILVVLLFRFGKTNFT